MWFRCLFQPRVHPEPRNEVLCDDVLRLIFDCCQLEEKKILAQSSSFFKKHAPPNILSLFFRDDGHYEKILVVQYHDNTIKAYKKNIKAKPKICNDFRKAEAVGLCLASKNDEYTMIFYKHDDRFKLITNKTYYHLFETKQYDLLFEKTATMIKIPVQQYVKCVRIAIQQFG